MTDNIREVNSLNINELIERICRAADDKKARDIVTMNMQGLMSSTDYFVICSAQTATQVRAIADNIEDELHEAGVDFNHKEGYNEGEWVLLDYGDVVAHVFREVNREYYALEELWGSADIKHFES
ncbi:MAG: ribosome silencing factor [Selenomonadaceae bacterium]|nr:ribosome silencing factor [Selenomonadaceae bacterium]